MSKVTRIEYFEASQEEDGHESLADSRGSTESGVKAEEPMEGSRGTPGSARKRRHRQLDEEEEEDGEETAGKHSERTRRPYCRVWTNRGECFTCDQVRPVHSTDATSPRAYGMRTWSLPIPLPIQTRRHGVISRAKAALYVPWFDVV